MHRVWQRYSHLKNHVFPKGQLSIIQVYFLTFILISASLLAAQDNLCKGMPAQGGIIPAGGLALAGTLKPSACLLGLTFSCRWSSVKVKLHLPFATRSSWGKLQASEWLTWDIMVICFDINGIACLGEKIFSMATINDSLLNCPGKHFDWRLSWV